MLEEMLDPVDEAEAKSGSRLKVIYHSTDGGLRNPTGEYFDNDLQTVCQVVSAADGEKRCLPLSESGVSFYETYADSRCSERSRKKHLTI